MILFNNKIILLILFLDLKNNDEGFNCLPCIYWLPKMHKLPSSVRFIIAGKKCIYKQRKKACYISIQTMLQSNRYISQKKHCFSETKTFWAWVIQNNSLPLECINKINKRKNTKQVSTFDFSTLYT